MTSVFRLHDAALDFLEAVQRSRNPRQVMLRAMNRTTTLSQPVELDDACAVLVVGEIVAALRGVQAEDVPQLVLTGSIAKQRNSLVDMRDLAVKAVKALLLQENELWAAGNEEEFHRMVGDLVFRLEGPPDFKRVDAILESKPRRPRIGDVFRLPLGGGKNAFGRMLRDGYFYIYSGVFDEDATPPVGIRDFALYSTGLHHVIGSEGCPIVGRDPLKNEECAKPLVHNGPGVRTTLWGLPEFPGGKAASPFQCMGVEQLGGDTVDRLKERILGGETSLARSLAVFGAFLSSEEVEMGIKALQGRQVRYFDEAENRRFNLNT